MFDASPSHPNGAAMKAKRDEGLKKSLVRIAYLYGIKSPVKKET
jgi:hypothetical protein